MTDIGVEIVTNSPVGDLAALRADGYDAVLVATGTPRSTSLGIPGEDSAGVLGGVEFLRDVRLDRARKRRRDVRGRREYRRGTHRHHLVFEPHIHRVAGRWRCTEVDANLE